MWLAFIGDTLEVLGTILIAITAIAVHDTVMKEKRIDEAVGKTIRKEHVLALLGITLVLAGFVCRQLSIYSQ